MTTFESKPAGRAAGRRRRQDRLLSHIVSSHGLLVLMLALIGLFSVVRANTFPTQFTFDSVLSGEAVVVILVLAEMLPVVANQFDLSIGYLVGLCHILVIGLMVKQGLSWELAVLVVLAIGVLFGAFNAFVVTTLRVNSFIATLGSGTFAYGLSQWYTGGTQVVGPLPNGFKNIGGATGIFGIPWAIVIALVVACVLWILLEYLPVGRRLYVVGSSQRAADLSGINSKRYIQLAFISSGFLTAVASVVVAAQLRIGEPSLGPDYLLPVFAAVFLGATSVRPGRPNVWGSMIAVFLIAVAVTGLQQLGAAFYVEYLFNGAILIAAVSVTLYANRRRVARVARSGIASSDEGEEQPELSASGV
jgi:ribose transport system permease protein